VRLPVRLGPGPVFAYEWLTTTRRWQLYALRAAFVGLVLIGMILAWRSGQTQIRSGQPVSIQTLASYGQKLFFTIVTIELSLVLLAAPAATAGAICLDKARGTLDHMLATDLSNAEIVLGKLGVRLIPVLGLIACLLPLTALTSLLGGIDPLALLGAFVTSVACALLGCSLAMALSVWGRKTHEVLMVTYLILAFWLSSPLLVMFLAFALGAPMPSSIPAFITELVEVTNPYFLVYAPYESPGKFGIMTFLSFLGSCLCVSGLLVLLAAVRIRAVALKQAGQAAAPRRRRFAPGFSRPAWLPRLPGPSLDGNPVLWREWQRFRPSRFLRVAWFLFTAFGLIGAVAALKSTAATRMQDEMIVFTTTFQVGVGLLLLSVSAATSLAEERTRGSLDILLSTPLSTFSILVGKWWGAFRLAPHVMIWPAFLAGILLWDGGSWFGYFLLLGLVMAYCVAIASLGLALATWVSRLGRAVAICVSIVVGLSIGWMFLVASIFQPNHLGIPLIMGSPLYGTAAAAYIVSSGPNNPTADDWRHAVAGAILWILIHGSAALVLFGLTLATFDHCMGRMAESSVPSSPRSAKTWPPSFDEELDDELLPEPALQPIDPTPG
jgi:ABC-type transport system involved in multi-copper enzyme maturation permease subunit